MRQIADWFDKLGLGQYAQRFDENGIDLCVLPHLTDQDLDKLGVLLGHRRKLLRAIADLKDIEKSAPTVAIAVRRPLRRVRWTPRSGASSLWTRPQVRDVPRGLAIAYGCSRASGRWKVGLDERSARCSRGLAMRLRADFIGSQ
jgi:hypothetical protein